MKNRTALVIAIVVVFALAALWMSGAVLAQRGQGGPGGPGGMMPPGPHIGMLKAGANGVFVLAGPALVKYSATLEEQGKLQLVQVTAATDQAPKIPLHGAMLVVPAAETGGEKVLVLLGDRFFAVDAASFEITAQGTLPAIDPPAQEGKNTNGNQNQKPMGPPPGPGGLEYRDGTLYVQRGPAIVAINVADGTVAGQVTLPKPDAQ